ALARTAGGALARVADVTAIAAVSREPALSHGAARTDGPCSSAERQLPHPYHIPERVDVHQYHDRWHS
ncbi:MAG: hypothetical protein WAM79_18375, partial [Candidatus Sulfotelmatobacter sp.]